MREKNLPAKVDELITEMLNKDPLVTASISAIPYFGSTLTTFFTAKWLQIYQERTKELFDRFREYLNELDEQTIKKDYFDTEEGIDLLIKATDQSAKTRSEEKRTLIARILTGAASTYAWRGEYSPEEYLNIVADLTHKELEIARTIYTLQDGISPTELESGNMAERWRLYEGEISKKHDIGVDTLPLLLNRLHSAGLLDSFYPSVWPSPNPHQPTYWVSPAFKNLMEFLRLEI